MSPTPIRLSASHSISQDRELPYRNIAFHDSANGVNRPKIPRMSSNDQRQFVYEVLQDKNTIERIAKAFAVL